MDVWLKKYLHASFAGVCCLFAAQTAYGIPYAYPPTNGPLSLADNDTLTVVSGTMATTSTTGYTVSFAKNGTVTVNSGATLSYSGNNSTASTIYYAVSDTNVTQIIANSGTINSGTGLYSVFIHNSHVAPTTHTVTINNGGSIIGNMYLSGMTTATLNLYNNSSISGVITAGVGTVNMDIGFDGTAASATTYTTLGTLQDIATVTVRTGSTLNLNLVDAGTSVGSINTSLTVNAGGTVNVNGSFSGTATISNSGTVNFYSSVANTGAISGTGAYNIYEAVTIPAAYASTGIGTHASVLTDSGSYGNATFTSATAPSINNFNLTYSNGYFAAGTYTLATSTAVAAMTVNNFGAAPASTLFVTFTAPAFSDGTNKVVKTTVTRTPYQTYATTPLAQQIGSALEYIGSHNPSSAMLTILNAVEASTNSGQLNQALNQLAPLASAPLYGLDVQVQNLTQVELRLAELRDQKHYFAGDISHEYTLWLRGYGDSANQQAVNDIQGYYATTGGTALGIDRLIDTGYIVGGAFSYAMSHVRDKRDNASVTDVKSYQAMLYGSYGFDASRYVDWIVGAASNDYLGARYININGLNYIASGKYSSQQFSIKGTWGKLYSLFDFLQATPEALLLYSYAKQYPYTETGAGAANLVVNRDNSNLVVLGVTGKLATPLDLNPGICVPEIKVTGLYNIVNGKQNTVANFAQGGSQFVTAMTLPRTSLILGFAVTFAVIDKFEVKLNYEHLIQDRFTDNSFYINLKYTV